MYRKIKKFFKYITHYSSNKKHLNMFNDKYCFPYLEDAYYRNLKYSNNPHRNNNEGKILFSISIVCHALEKGLIRGENLRLGFGQSKIQELSNLLDIYFTNYDIQQDTSGVIANGLAVLTEYKLLHKKNNYIFENTTYQLIDDIVNKYAQILIEDGKQVSKHGVDYFDYADKNFSLFSNSRHSLRNFDTNVTISEETINEVISLAQNAPSACNRQSTRIYAVYNEDLQKKISLLQNNGIKGVSYEATVTLVLTSDLQAWNFGEEWFAPYLDGGIYLMNLLYALHFHKIGACPLNWYATIDKDKQLRELIQVPENEVILGIIACGKPKDKVMLAKSKRRNVSSVLKFIM